MWPPLLMNRSARARRLQAGAVFLESHGRFRPWSFVSAGLQVSLIRKVGIYCLFRVRNRSSSIIQVIVCWSTVSTG